MSPEQLVEDRYRKFRKLGPIAEAPQITQRLDSQVRE